MNSALHLVRRFFRSIQPGSISTGDADWVASLLVSGERALWARMSNPDQRHGVEVARAVSEVLGDRADRPILAAALLHDVGKVVSNYRTPARVVATAVWLVLPSDLAQRWQDRGKPVGRLSQYRLHPQLGEQLLIEAGSEQVTSAWSGDHHLDEDQWRLDASIARALKDCDND